MSTSTNDQRTPHADGDDYEFRALLAHLRNSRGFDFGAYKPASLRRRVLHRMRTVGEPVRTFGDYLDYLKVHPEEFTELFNTILINVTSFFRDPQAWDFVARQIVPEILRNAGGDGSIRCWSAGCASGEEPYTLAMVLAEAMGKDAYRQRAKIYATDVDEEELAQARLAVYSAQDLQPVPLDLRERYFEPSAAGFQVCADLRRSVIYGRHDLVQDAPISRLDLLVCRNTLMYLNAETQGRIVNRFHFALRDSGYLFLGCAEMLLTHTDLFRPVELKHRVFSKVRRPDRRELLLELGQGADVEELYSRVGHQARLRKAALEATTDAILVIAASGALVTSNQRARDLFGLRATDHGRPFRDLEVSYRPVELRGPIEQAMSSLSTVSIPDVERHPAGGETQYLEVRVVPVANSGDQILGVTVAVADVTRYRTLEAELQRTNVDLETACEELETANEELQSTVEELETTNEELQSSNEELETMNEELHSANEELEAVNEELSQRTREASEASAFFEAVVASLKGGLVVLDDKLDIVVWNPRAEDLWGLRAHEVIGRSLFALDIGLPVEELREPLRQFVTEELVRREMTVDAISRRGKSIVVHITFTPFGGARGVRRGVVMLMVERES